MHSVKIEQTLPRRREQRGFQQLHVNQTVQTEINEARNVKSRSLVPARELNVRERLDVGL